MDLTPDSLRQVDLVVVLQHHAAIDFDELTRLSRRVIDTRGRLTGDNVVLL